MLNTLFATKKSPSISLQPADTMSFSEQALGKVTKRHLPRTGPRRNAIRREQSTNETTTQSSRTKSSSRATFCKNCRRMMKRAYSVTGTHAFAMLPNHLVCPRLTHGPTMCLHPRSFTISKQNFRRPPVWSPQCRPRSRPGKGKSASRNSPTRSSPPSSQRLLPTSLSERCKLTHQKKKKERGLVNKCLKCQHHL